MSVYKRANRWYYYIKIRGQRHRGVIPEARTKYQAQEAERKIRDQIFEGKYSNAQSRKTLKEFVEEVYLPWAKVNKRSWRSNDSRLKPILAHFGKKRLSDISPFQIERFKIERLKMPIVRGENGEKTRPRTRASVNREVRLFSRIFTLAIANREASTNPVSQVKLFKGENRRTRYLLPEEEERLMAQLTGQRAHIRLIVIVALHTGMRMGEAGIDPFTIAAILGHKSIAMTASYTHATQRAKRLAVAALEEAIEKQGHKVGHNEERRPRLAAAK